MPRAFLIKNKKQQANGNGPNQDQLTDTDAREASLDERRSGTPTQEEERLEGEEGGRNPEHLEKTREKDTYSERANIFMISNLKIPHQAGNNQRPPPLIELQRLPYRFSPMMISPEREPRRGDSPASDLPEKGYTGREFPPVRRMSSPPVDPISIYPSPSPSSEEHVTCDDASTSSDDEPRDLNRDPSGNDVMTPTFVPKPRLTSLHPEMRWSSHVTSQPRHAGFPSPGTSPEPDHGQSPKRRRSDESVSSSSLSISPPRHDTLHPGDVSPDMSRQKTGEAYWPNGFPGMGMSLSVSAHHPYLALSFQRLQQLHIKAAQEGITKFPHLSPPPLSSLGSLPLPHLPPFAPLPPGAGLPPPPPSPVGSPGCGLVRRPLSPSRPRSEEHSYTSSRVRDYPLPSPNKTAVTHVTSTHVLPSPQPEVMPPKAFAREESLPLDLDTKSAAEKRKRREGEPPRYNCESCGKSYSTFSGLSKHKQFHCTSHIQKQFNCKYCDKTYVSLGALKMHIRTHTLPCKCHLCGKAFSRPWLLQGHVRTHTGEKPFQCSHCGRSFADRSNLRAHLQTHSDVKKYSCRTCSKTFSRMSLLLKHEDGGCAGLAHS